MGLLTGAGNVTTAANQASTSSLSITIPANTQAGDLLLWFCYSGFTGAGTFNTPAGWTILASLTNGTTTCGRVLGKIATGTDAGTNVSHSSSANARTGAIMVRGTGYDSSALSPDTVGTETYRSTATASPQSTTSIVTTKTDTVVTFLAYNSAASTAAPSFASALGSIITGNADTAAGTATKLEVAVSASTAASTYNDSWSWTDGTTSRGSTLMLALPLVPAQLLNMASSSSFGSSTTKSTSASTSFASSSSFGTSTTASLASSAAFASSSSFGATSSANINVSVAFASASSFAVTATALRNLTATFASTSNFAALAVLSTNLAAAFSSSSSFAALGNLGLASVAIFNSNSAFAINGSRLTPVGAFMASASALLVSATVISGIYRDLVLEVEMGENRFYVETEPNRFEIEVSSNRWLIELEA